MKKLWEMIFDVSLFEGEEEDDELELADVVVVIEEDFRKPMSCS